MDRLNRLLVTFLQLIPQALVRPFAMRYIAGEELADAVRVIKELNSRGMLATVDVLGEDVTSREESLRAVEEGEEVLRSIRDHGLLSNLSIKLTQYGLKLDEAFCRSNVRRVLETARRFGNFVRIDMEDSSTTSATLRLYENLQAEGFENVGVVIQAGLRRSEGDLLRLLEHRVNVRLVKGIYVEPEEIAYRDREEIRRNFLGLLSMLLEARCYVGIATHDDFLIRKAEGLIRELGISPPEYEFQMLYGIRPGLRDRVAGEGHRMRIYVPFGRQWYSYSLRRFKENPQVARYVLESFFSRE